MAQAVGNNMELDKLGVGSIVEVNGILCKKRVDGWVVLEESVPAYMGGATDYKVVASVKKGPLDDFVEGDIISFESSYGVRVATKLRDDFWQITGSAAEWTTDELDSLVLDEDSVRKVGSLDGGS